MSSRLRTAVDPLVASVGVSERRRLVVVLGVPFAFWLGVELAANLGLLPPVLAGGLAAYLYTRRTARATLAAGSGGTGLLIVSLFLLQMYQISAGGSTEPLTGAAARLFEWVLLGALLFAFGAWVSDADGGDS